MELAETTRKFVEPEALKKPDGGYFCVLGEQLLLLVWLIREQLLSPLALRAYLGLVELRGERFVRFLIIRRELKEWSRAKVGPPPKPIRAHYAILPELSIRTGLSVRHLARAMKELEDLGLVSASDSRITFADSLDKTSGFDKEAFRAFASAHESHRRRLIPIGRRILNYLASGAGEAKNLGTFFAVVAGLSLRGAYYYARSENPYRFAGWARIDRLSEFVGTSERTIQRMKARLCGWYEPLDVRSMWAKKNYGERFRLNPHWSPEKTEVPAEGQWGDTSQLSPLKAPNSAPTVTPYRDESNKESPYGTKNQDNESRPGTVENFGPDDFQSGPRRIKNQDHVPKAPSVSSDPPRLSDIKPELDFSPQGTGRLLELFRQGGKCGLVGTSDNDRLRWVATAIRVMNQPSIKRPAAVFLAIIKGRRFTDPTDGDYEAANLRIREYLYGRPEDETPKIVLRLAAVEKSPEPPKPKQRELTEDARYLLALRQHYRLRHFEQVFPALRTRGWDRPRFLSAVTEIEGKKPG